MYPDPSQGQPEPIPAKTDQSGKKGDAEERISPAKRREEVREKMLDKTLEDSFPTSDPPSSIPDPSEDDSFAA